MSLKRTQLVSDEWSVDRRLTELGLNRRDLLQAVDMAMAAAANATPFHPANSPGTFAYHEGTFALRNIFVRSDWLVDRYLQLEAIRNDRLRLRVIYSNVDIATNIEHGPKPRSRKGAGAARACQPLLFDNLPQFSPVPDEPYATYFLMVDSRGAAELTRPIVQDGTYSHYVERVFLRGPEDGEEFVDFEPDTDVDGDFEPTVMRKV